MFTRMMEGLSCAGAERMQRNHAGRPAEGSISENAEGEIIEEAHERTRQAWEAQTRV